MKIQHRFNTQREAASYLEKRGWVYAGRNCGDKVFKHSVQQMGGRVLVKLNTGRWKIQIL